MQNVELKAQKREIASRGKLGDIRRAGEVPAIVYGGKKDAAPMRLNGKELLQVLKAHGANVIISLLVDGKKDTVLVKEVQRDILTHAITHVDFQRISLTEKLEVNVPLHVKGEAPGVKLSGGILEHILREFRVRVLPTAIPASIDVDVSALQINQGLKAKDIKLPEGVELLTDSEHIVVNVVAPMVFEETPAPGAAAAVPGAAEPEVIAKGKKPEEGAEAAPAAGGKAPAAGAKPAAAPAAGKEAKK
jgi:large subunit ribosomal protein L25